LTFFSIFILLFISSSVCAQRESDVGLIFGTSYYQGDINPNSRFYSPSFAAGITYRYNLNTRFVIKSEFNYLSVSATDADFTDDKFQTLRNLSFQSNIYDLSAQFEFNFLPLKFEKLKYSFSPFVSSGLAGAMVLRGKVDPLPRITLPLDIGIRTTIYRKWSVGVQWSFRKTFGDEKFDGVMNPFDNSMTSIFNNNDWYSFAGVFVTYKIFDMGGSCPAYTGEGHGLNLYK
jgi:hypothetical protein